MTNILGISGRLQSGKTTSAQFLMASTLASLGIIDAFRFEDDGTLVVKSGESSGETDLLSLENIEFYQNQWLDDFGITVDKTTKVYSFADDLKQKVCIDLLGLTYEQCYGTNDDKNSLTHLRWEDMPGWAGPIIFEQGQIEKLYLINEGKFSVNGAFQHDPGFMTAREVMQFVGTKIFRKMYSNVWVDSTIRKIIKDDANLAVIADCRFLSEVEEIQKHGGKVIRLLRNPYDNSDESETELDNCNDFDLIINNSNMTIQQTNTALKSYLESIGWWPSWRLSVEDNS